MKDRKAIMNKEDVQPDLSPLGILIEVAHDEGCFAHIPALPGLCFRASEAEEAKRMAAEQIAKYSKWLLAEDLADLNTEVESTCEMRTHRELHRCAGSRERTTRRLSNLDLRKPGGSIRP